MEPDDNFFRKLQEGYRMDKPKYATNPIEQVMQRCWNADPGNRPSFGELEEDLGDQLEASVKRHYIELNNPFIQSNDVNISTDYLSMMSPAHYVNVGKPSPETSRTYVNIPTNNQDDNRQVIN